MTCSWEVSHLTNLLELKTSTLGATSLFRSFKHMSESQSDGLGEDGNYASYVREHKIVPMLSGWGDDQTRADANIIGTSEGL